MECFVTIRKQLSENKEPYFIIKFKGKEYTFLDISTICEFLVQQESGIDALQLYNDLLYTIYGIRFTEQH